MSISDILAIAGAGGGGGLILLLTLIQISKININPWSAIWRALGNAMTRGVMAEVRQMNDAMEARLDTKIESVQHADESRCCKTQNEVRCIIDGLRINMDAFAEEMRGNMRSLAEDFEVNLGERDATQARYRILRFNDEIARNDFKHSKEHFDQILEMIDDYEAFCANHKSYENSKCVHAIKNIRRIYDKATIDNDFL